MFGSERIIKLMKQKERFKGLQPQPINTSPLEKDILQNLSKESIISGSFALRFYKPQYVAKDIDIVSSKKREQAYQLVNALNKKYNDRFEVHKSYNAYRIWDKKQRKYVIDVASYPIKQSDYTTVNGLSVAKPHYVIRGKIRRVRTSWLPRFW